LFVFWFFFPDNKKISRFNTKNAEENFFCA